MCYILKFVSVEGIKSSALFGFIPTFWKQSRSHSPRSAPMVVISCYDNDNLRKGYLGVVSIGRVYTQHLTAVQDVIGALCFNQTIQVSTARVEKRPRTNRNVISFHRQGQFWCEIVQTTPECHRKHFKVKSMYFQSSFEIKIWMISTNFWKNCRISRPAWPSVRLSLILIKHCGCSRYGKTYRKIPKVNPGALFEGLIFGGAYLRREICLSNRLG